jgi:hypothetical protein
MPGIYNPNIPQAPDVLSQSQNQLLQDFTSLGSMLDPVNTTMTLTLQAPIAPNPVTAVNEMAIFLQLDVLRPTIPAAYGGPVPALQTMCVKFPQVGIVTGEIQDMTSSFTWPDPNPTHGWTSLPSGIIIQWGTNNTANPPGTVTFPVPFPTNVFAIIATEFINGARSVIQTNTAAGLAQFNVQSRGATNLNPITVTTFSWIAIGN